MSLNHIPEQPALPLRAKLFQLVYKLAGRKQRVDQLLTPLLKYRHFLPAVEAAEVIPDFNTSRLSITTLPHGPWATPMIDTLTVLKAVVGFKPERILEVGSYKGVTALLMAENTPETATIFALDRDINHGEAYAGLPAQRKIVRLVGDCTPDILSPHAPFDFIFVDADHDYRSVVKHTLVAIDILSPAGVIMWHDYRHDSFLHGGCAVAEALDAVSRGRHLLIFALENTTLAIYSPRLDSLQQS